MSAKKRGLGRGLGSLIPTAPPVEATEAAESVEAAQANEFNGSSARSTANGSMPPAATRTESLAGQRPATPARLSDSVASGATAAVTSATADPDAHSSASATSPSDEDGKAVADGVEPVNNAPSVSDGDDLNDLPAFDDVQLQPVAGARFAEVDITSIRANAKQPRQVFDDEALEELTHSVREFGVLQPIVVRPLPESERASGDGDVRYELVMGERRLRASTAAGLTVVPAIIRDTADDAMLRDALLENLHRVQLNPLEEAAAYQQLLEEFGATHEELARRIGRSRSQVSNTIRLMNLPVVVQRRVAAGVLSAGHARALLSLEDTDSQDELAARIVAEGLSVRATEELVALAVRGVPKKPTRRPTRKITAPAIADLSEKLSDRFDTRVLVDIGRRKGNVTIEFGSIDDLERIVAMIAPDLRAGRSADTDPDL